MTHEKSFSLKEENGEIVADNSRAVIIIIIILVGLNVTLDAILSII